jgi:predicted O-linked N-acetylglucosamine transferase (SPINDLY family)
MTTDADGAFAAALAHHEAGRLEEARAGYGGVLVRDPEHAESLHLLGLISALRGDPDGGVEMIRRAIELAPGRAPHHNSLGLALRVMGRDADAVHAYEKAAALRPGSAEILNNLAATLRDLGRHAEAVARYRLAASCAPETAEIWYNLAGALEDAGAAAEVEDCYRRAIALRPELGDAIGNFGRWLIARSRWSEAESWLSEAVTLDLRDARSWNNLGIARHELGQTEAAAASYRRALALDPGFADAHYNLGCLLSGEGRPDDALARHAAAIAADRLHGAARLALCMAWLPIIYRTEAEIADRRANYRAGLDRLARAVEAPDVARAVANAIGASQPFFLPYQAENDREQQSVFGGLACRLLADEQPRLAPPPRSGERIRLGIVSGFFEDHTIFKLFLEGWLTELDRDRFEVIGFHTGRADDARGAALCDRFVRDLSSVAAWRNAVVEAAPHVLLYPEVGIDPICGALAARRLAPVQCVAWGHPETTGMPTMDYFLSSDLMEPEDGEQHYTERLVRLPGLGLHYTPDELALPPLDRTAFGLDPDVPVYWSGQSLYKYLPRHDLVFPRIAAAVGPCQFVFIGFAKSQAVTEIFRDRLRQAFARFDLDADRYCVLLPPMPQERFLAAVGLADVVLDTPEWSGGRSTLDCLTRSPAIVTLPGRFMRGRHTMAILRHIGCEATIAYSPDDYVAIASRLGLDAAWRDEVRRTVAAGKNRAFRDTAPVRALETFLSDAVLGRLDPADRAGRIAPLGRIGRETDRHNC